MAKRRTKEQIQADRIIKGQLNELGEKIYQQAKARSRVKTGQLRNSVNYMVKPDVVLTVAQVYYGAAQNPNELEVAINDHVDQSINLIVQEIVDGLTNTISE